MRKLLIIGATSAIAHETAKIFAAGGAWLFLVGRNLEKLGAVSDDLRARGARRVETLHLDLTEFDRHEELLRKAVDALDGLDAVLIAHGMFPDQKVCEASVAETMSALKTNCLSVISLLTLLANYFEQQGYGTIAVITSKSGDRGRQSTYVYGASKGAVDIFLEGLRSRLFKVGVSVITIKPGLVRTPMTASMPQNFLFTSTKAVGQGVYKAMIRGKDEVYLPWFWRWIMLIIKMIPEPLYKRMNL